MEKTESSKKTVSIRVVIITMIIVMLAISALLIAETFKVATEYNTLNNSISDYAKWQKDANNLQIGSDYLTEQVRCFAVTGERVYLDNYFEEANETRRRDKAVEGVHNVLGESGAYNALVNAMGESVDLMNREYYSMRLTIEGYGLDLSKFPEEVQAVVLSDEEKNASAEVQRENGRQMVFDSIYHSKKEAITANVQKCLEEMDLEMSARQASARTELEKTLTLQRVLILVFIALLIITFLLFFLLIVTPLLKAVTFIQKNQPIPVNGAKEFQFLAKEYNIMHKTNASQKQELAFEATHDNLTGIYNRNGYDSIQQSVDWDTCALVLFDLDRFKPINDTFGHKMGDRVLQRTASAIQNAFRAQDYVCRIGGDEFAVIMTQVTPGIGDQIRDKVKRINMELNEPEGEVPGIKISCGVAYGALIKNFDILFREADAALYRVKNAGGGGCEIVE